MGVTQYAHWNSYQLQGHTLHREYIYNSLPKFEDYQQNINVVLVNSQPDSL